MLRAGLLALDSFRVPLLSTFALEVLLAHLVRAERCNWVWLGFR